MLELQDELGIPATLLGRMLSAKDLDELRAYRMENPHWTTKMEIYLARIAYVIACANTSKEQPAPDWNDYLIDFKKSSKQQSEDDVESFLMRQVTMGAA